MARVDDIVGQARERDVHVRQYFDGRPMEIWADGELKARATRPIDAEMEVRRVLGVTNAEGVAVEVELARRAATS